MLNLVTQKENASLTKGVLGAKTGKMGVSTAI